MTDQTKLMELLNTAIASANTTELCCESLAYLDEGVNKETNEYGYNATRLLICEYQQEKATEVKELIGKCMRILEGNE